MISKKKSLYIFNHIVLVRLKNAVVEIDYS